MPMKKKRTSNRLLRGEKRKEFIAEGTEFCPEGFENTREELLKICENEKDAQVRWEKSKELLLENLESQMPLFDLPLMPIKKTTKGSKRKKIDKNLIESWRKFYSIVNDKDKSYLYDCIKIVSAYNAYDNPDLLPNDIKFSVSHELDYESYCFRHDSVRIIIYLKSLEKISIDESKNFYSSLLSPHSVLEYISNGKDDIALICNENFLDEFKRMHPDIARVYKFTKQHEPNLILSHLNKDFQRKFLKHFLSKKIENWSWSGESEDRIIEPLFNERVLEPRNLNSEDIEYIRMVENPVWEPDSLLVNPKLMCYEIAGDFLKSLSEHERNLCIYESCLKIGFELLDLPYIKGVMDYWYDTNKLSELRTLSKFLYESFLSKRVNITGTEKTYWRIYLDVNRLVGLGKKKEEAYKILASRYNMKKSTLSTRYKERASIAKSRKLDTNSIIKRYGLHKFESVLPSVYRQNRGVYPIKDYIQRFIEGQKSIVSPTIAQNTHSKI